jgi:peptidoglycan/LPS O-acetylase OafA/YrhL
MAPFRSARSGNAVPAVCCRLCSSSFLLHRDRRPTASSQPSTNIYQERHCNDILYVELLLLATWRLFQRADAFHPLLHTWSLAVEEQFYILFPLFLLLCGAGFRTVSSSGS